TLDVGRLYADIKQVYLDARSNAAEFNEPRLHVDVMFGLVEMLGHLVVEITKLRAQTDLGEAGLAGFDSDLVGLTKRYTNLYQPFFDDASPPSQWTEERWQSYQEDVEGPILLWDRETCQERWSIEFGSPACDGPDLLTALSLLHQTGVALEFQQELLGTLLGLLDKTLGGLVTTLGEGAKHLAQRTADAFRKVRGAIKQYVVPSERTVRRFAWGVGAAVGVVGLGGYLLLEKNKTKTKGK
ncbi:MAG: hypothetical protein K0V04_24910, partial [Deltaproteobacteria bacterium]|nr:hypothetical protein [Deltaproteobacteria bacterium]